MTRYRVRKKVHHYLQFIKSLGSAETEIISFHSIGVIIFNYFYIYKYLYITVLSRIDWLFVRYYNRIHHIIMFGGFQLKIFLLSCDSVIFPKLLQANRVGTANKLQDNSSYYLLLVTCVDHWITIVCWHKCTSNE